MWALIMEIMMVSLTYENFDSASHTHLLFRSLKNRRYSISHSQMPDYEEHVAFCKNHPYRIWLMVFEQGDFIGSVYLGQNNAIGINIDIHKQDYYDSILKYILKTYEPLDELKSVTPPYFYVNCPSQNIVLAQSLRAMRAQDIQTTYSFLP